MSILWCGGEDIDFPNGDIPSMGSTAGSFRSSWARGYIMFSTAGQLAKSIVFPGGEITSAWLSCQWMANAAQTNRRYAGFGKSGTTKGIFFGTSVASAARGAIFSYDGSTQSELVADTTNIAVITNTLYRADLQLSSYGGSSTIRLYLGGVLCCTFSGDSSISGVNGFDSVFFYCPITTGTPLSEVIVADADTRSFGLRTLYPNEAGDALWEGGTYADIDELTQSDSDLVYTNSGDDDCSVGLVASPTGTFRVAAAKACARAYASADGTPNGLALGVKSGSYDYGTKQNLTNSWFSYERLMTVNPVTTNEWTQAEIDALQLNLRSKT